MLGLKKCLSFFLYNLIAQISGYNLSLTKSLKFDFGFYKVFSSASSFLACLENLFLFHPRAASFFYSSYLPFISQLKLSPAKVFRHLSGRVKLHATELWRLPEYLDFFLSGLQSSPSFAFPRLLNFWHLRTPLSIISYLNQEVPEWSSLNTLIYKAMKQLNTPQLNFFLDKFLQYIKTWSHKIVLFSILELTSSSPLFAHQVLWQVDVVLNQKDLQVAPEESYPNFLRLSPNRFLESPSSDSRLTVKQIRDDFNMLKSLTFSRFNSEERDSFRQIDAFQKSLTRICNVMQPKFSKDRKKELIVEELGKMKLPPFFYLPTHPNYRITSFDPQKAIPMNSAAKCPYLIFFKAVPFDESELFSATPAKDRRLVKRFNRQAQFPRTGESTIPESAPDFELTRNLFNVSTRSRPDQKSSSPCSRRPSTGPTSATSPSDLSRNSKTRKASRLSSFRGRRR